MAENPKDDLAWLQSDSPWQTLAVMLELNDAWKMDNPAEFVSKLHVHVDGSCNGMQHYAAFGRDSAGGR